MTEEQEHYCEVEVIKCPHFPTLLALSLETGASPAEILAAVNRRRPRFGGFVLPVGGPDGFSLYTARHVRQGAYFRRNGCSWYAVMQKMGFKYSKGWDLMRGKIEALLAEHRDEIQSDFADGMSAVKMGQKYGVSHQTIINMKNRMLDELAQAAQEDVPAPVTEKKPEESATTTTQPEKPKAQITPATIRLAAEVFSAISTTGLSAPETVEIYADGIDVRTKIVGRGWIMQFTAQEV